MITTEIRRHEFIGSGALTPVPYQFKILDKSHLAVYMNGSLKVEGVDYTVSGVGTDAGGNITPTATTVFPAAGEGIILGVTPATQATALTLSGNFSSQSVEDALDKEVQLLAEFKEKLTRTPVLSVADSYGVDDLQLPAPQSKRYLRWNTAATNLEAVAGAADISGVLDDVIPESTFAGLPAAGTAGRLRLVTDAIPGLYRDTGSTWQRISHYEGGVPPVTKAITFTVAQGDYGRTFVCSSTITADLTAAVTLGSGFKCRFINAGAGVITINPNLAETIDATATLALNAGDECEIECDGANFYSISRFRATGVDGPGFILNGKIEAAVSSKALTISLKTKAGADPSAADPVDVAFRSSTLTEGTYVVRRVTYAVSVTVSSGSSLAFTANLAGRIRGYLLDNAGVVELAAYHAYNPTGPSLKSLNEGALHSTTAEGGAGGADSAQVLYSATARSSVAIRELGYIEITTGAVAGEWDNAPTVKQTMGPGIPQTGDHIQLIKATYATMSTTTAAWPYDDTIPQVGEGAQISSDLDITFTPSSAINLVSGTVRVPFADSVTSDQTGIGVFQDATGNAVEFTWQNSDQAGTGVTVNLDYLKQIGTASSTAFKVRIGAQGGTITINGTTGARKYGGGMRCTHVLTEIFT